MNIIKEEVVSAPQKMVKKTKPNGNGLMRQIHSALTSVNGWGSVELYVQNGKVTQITSRSIQKTEHKVEDLSR